MKHHSIRWQLTMPEGGLAVIQVSRQIAEALELEVIKGLEWRLSPYFLTPRRR